MPVPPPVFNPGPVSPQQLNVAMYSFDGTGFGANGILFHTHKPIVSQTLVTSGTAYPSLTQTPVNGPGVGAYCVVDKTALFSVGSDRPGTLALFQFSNYMNATAGNAGTNGGYWLHWGFPFTGGVNVPPGGVGAGLILSGNFRPGVFQYAVPGHNNCPYFLDLVAAGTAGNLWQPAFWWETPSTPVLQATTQDTSGQTTRMGWLWEGVSQGGGTVPSVPGVNMSWGTVLSSQLNNNLGTVITFLNNPPMLRVTTTTGQTFTTAANTIVQFNSAPNLDNYSGWSTAVSQYIVPLPGLYLFSPTVVWGTTSAANVRLNGLQVTAGGTVYQYQGATYKATPVGTGTSGVGFTVTSQVRVLNLQANDRVSVYGFQNSGGNLSLLTSLATRFIGAYMSPVAPGGSVMSYAVPNTSFRWQAGALSGTALTTALNQHLGTDIAFLMNKPYFSGVQQMAQTGFADNSGFHQITMDVVGAPPWGGNGDNYNAWDALNSRYVSKLAGWYLVIADLYPVPPISGTAGIVTAGIHVSSSGGVIPGTAPDQFQQVYYPINGAGSPPPGAFGMGLYYLLPGEHVYPMLQVQSWGGTWGTYVSASGTVGVVNSQFSCFWVSA